jgi:drug/metabolite transporter (DMT)-like permease
MVMTVLRAKGDIQMPRSSTNGLILAVVSALCFGFSGPLARLLIDAGLSPLQVVWTRLAGAALVLLLVTLTSRPRALVVPRRRLVFVAAYSLLGFAAVQAFYYATAPIGATIASLEVVASVVIAWWLLGQSLGPFQLLGGALVLSGALSAQLAVARTRSVEPGGVKPGGVEPGREEGTRDVRSRIAARSSSIN